MDCTRLTNEKCEYLIVASSKVIPGMWIAQKRILPAYRDDPQFKYIPDITTTVVSSVEIERMRGANP